MPSAAFKNAVMTQWDPRGLNSSLARGFRASVYVARNDAKMTAPNSKSSATSRVTSDTSGVLIPTGLGTIFEVGRVGGYPIFPGGVKVSRRSYSRGRGVTFRERQLGGASKTAGRSGNRAKALLATHGPLGGQYFAYAVGGDMKPDPYIKPAANRWSHGGCQATMSRSLIASGFRPR